MLDSTRTRSLNKRITVLTMVGIVATTLVLSSWLAIPAYRESRLHSEHSLILDAEGRALAVQQYFAKLRQVVRQLSGSARAAEAMELYRRGNLSPKGLRDSTAPELEDSMRLAPDLLGIARYDADGRLLVRIGVVIAPGEAIRLMGRDSPTETQVFVEGREVLLVKAPIVVSGGVTAGIDVYAFDLDHLNSLLAAGDHVAGRQKYAVGTVHDDGSLALLPSGRFDASIPGGEDGNAMFDAVQFGLSGSTGLLRERPIAGDQYTLAFSPVEAGRWALVSFIRTDILYARARRQILLMGLAVLVVLIVGSGGTLSFIRPINERIAQQAEQLSAHSEEHRILFENSGDVVYRQTSDGGFTFVSPSIERITGYSVAEWATGHPGYVTDNPSNVAAVARNREAVLAGTEHPPFEMELWHKLGHRITLEIKERPFFHGQAVAGVIGIARDVTDRKRAEVALKRSTAEWNHALDFVEDAICLLDLHGRVIRANRSFFRMWNKVDSEALGRPLLELIDRVACSKASLLSEAIETLQDTHFTLESDDSCNEAGVPLDVSLRIIRNDMGAGEGIVVAFGDLTRVRRTEDELRLAASVFENSLEGILITEADSTILKVNQAFTDITGFDPEEVIGKRPSILSSGKNDNSFYRELWSTLARTGRWQGEIWNRRKNGEVFPVWESISTVRDESGQPSRYIGIFTDVTEKKASEQRIHYLANFDAVTHLPNRFLFNDRLGHALERAKREGSIVALLFLDLDGFKTINDSLGHVAGDALLREVAERLRRQVREQDTVCRLGGDEFTVILEGLSEARPACGVAEKILDTLSRAYLVDGHEVYASASIGVSLFPNDGKDASALLKNADTAMYRSKEQGRNGFQFYTAEMTEAARERFSLEVALRHAVGRSEFVLHYQPQVDASTGRVVGAEALIRWMRPGHGLVSPTKFIPLAEDSRLIKPIGDWVLETACAQMQTWRAAGMAPERLAVNLSARQFEDGGLVNKVLRILHETGLDPSSLELEITESILMENQKQAASILEDMHRIGVQIAIDDFGTGYSSLGYLKRFPIDRIKIDRSFVLDIPHSTDDEAIAGAIIAMGRSLGIEVIAEGVETEAQLEFLRASGCNEVQGFLYSPPLVAEDLDLYMVRRSSNPRFGFGLHA